ncbi:uncharacterized protein [Nicotiana tomentosiformis]|uniref:uncharacterized protein n=1 Tax=Nicotiana tomentosiformis TaxID=4098 RepID=UPI00388CA54F
MDFSQVHVTKEEMQKLSSNRKRFSAKDFIPIEVSIIPEPTVLDQNKEIERVHKEAEKDRTEAHTYNEPIQLSSSTRDDTTYKDQENDTIMEGLTEEQPSSKSDNELTQTARKSLLIEGRKDTTNQVQQNITFFNNLSPRRLRDSRRSGTFYAKCDKQLRNLMWDDLRETAGTINGPWGFMGDFNIISNVAEKLGGRDFRVEESLDFISYLSDCEIHDGGYVGSGFTWTDNRDPPNTIWKRLDILVYNAEWFDLFGGTSVTHMSRSCSDRSPLLIACGSIPSEHVRTAFGDIYEEPKKLEMEIRILEEVYLNDNNQGNMLKLSKAKAEFTRFLKLQDSVLRQKARVEGTTEIADAGVRFFHDLFSVNNTTEDLQALNIIKKVINDDDNNFLMSTPSTQEVKDNIFSIDPDSAPGPDGLSGRFYQTACFSDIRPISLCNVIGKITAKVINARLSSLLPKIISTNQSDFVKGRAITENILLAQKIVSDIRKPMRGGNVVIKLDMTKAYDREWINLIYRFIFNNWYSLIVNGSKHGFFKSSRGLRQGDPLSPPLFVLSVELLSQMLNALQNNRRFHGFYMKRQGPQVNHLAFADDTILFTSGEKHSLQLILNILNTYETVSDQLINKNKSCYSMAENTPQSIIRRVEMILGMRFDKLPMRYLGCPIYYGRKKICIFVDMITKTINRVIGWHLKFLSSGGMAVLIRHVLLAINTHTLAAIHPPKGSLDVIEMFIARFFWSDQEEGERYHWVSWSNLCFPYEEGEANFRRLEDINQAFTAKQWWNLRTSNSLWSQFMKAKYFGNEHPVNLQWRNGQSHSWKAIFLNEGLWDWSTLNIQPPDNMKDQISALQINLHPDENDTPIWNEIQDGKFSIASAWKTLRQRKHISQFDSMIWHKNVPFKMACITWRTVHDIIPTDDRIKKILPPIVIWELWRSRCSSKYEMERPTVAGSILLINFNIIQIVKAQFRKLDLNYTWENLRRIKPPILFVKLNSDGSCRNGECGGGGLVRDSLCKFIMAYSISLGQCTSSWAEACAFLFGIKWCIEKRFNLIIGEINSMLLQNCISGSWTIPWRIKEAVQDIKKLINRQDIFTNHCFREANQVADRMASLSHNQENQYICTNFCSLPSQIKGLLNTYRWQMLSFRVKKRRPSMLTFDPP